MKKLWILGVLLLTFNVKAESVFCLADEGKLLNLHFERGNLNGMVLVYQNNEPVQTNWLEFAGEGQWPQYGINKYLLQSKTGEEVKVVISKFESRLPGNCGRGSCRAPTSIVIDKINVYLTYLNDEILFNCY
jgi:hypothetical protein